MNLIDIHLVFGFDRKAGVSLSSQNYVGIICQNLAVPFPRSATLFTHECNSVLSRDMNSLRAYYKSIMHLQLKPRPTPTPN